MGQDGSNLQDELRRKFPEMRPIKSAPWLGSINGFGLGLYGKRDVDPESETYVKTRCICALFVPLVAVGAYRVGEAGHRTWYFFGKEPLSFFARIWNGIAACAAIFFTIGICWNSYISSPSYQARKELTHAAQLLSAGEADKAAGIYRKLLVEEMPYAEESRKGLQSSLEKALESESAATVETAFRLIVSLPAKFNQPSPIVPEPGRRGLALVDKFRAKDPESALRILDQVSGLSPKKETVQPLRIELLQETVSANPGNTNRVVELALVYESAERLDDCIKLLLPYQRKLGSTEGARILGQHLLQERKNDDAYGLLYPYVQARLEKLRSIESAYTNTLAAVYKRAREDLSKGRAGESFYTAYDKASKAERGALVDSYVQKQMQNDPGLTRAVANLKAANTIVHVTLDLGIVQLARAQDLKDIGARKAELEAAEKTFLAIRGVAGETDEYRLFLGQVYYWLGKSREGKELFDQLLVSKKRAYLTLISLARTLRDVGDLAQARALVEEAYASSKAEKQKFAAASFRSYMFKDTDDQISWLEKSDANEPTVQIALNCARGEKALQQGNKELAAQHLRKAVAGYEQQPKSAPDLNNWGLACLSLYEASGNIADHTHGVALLEEAISLDPGNSVLLINTMHTLLSSAVMEVVRDSIRTEALGESVGSSLLAHLYLDEAGRNEVYHRLRETESMKKALGYLDKALLLAPKSLNLYHTALHFQAGFEDLGEMQKLEQRFKIAEPDLSEMRKEELEAFAGAKDKEFLEKYQARIKMLEGLQKAQLVREHTLTLERVNVSLSESRQNAFVYGGQTDSKRLVEDAQLTLEKHPSAASHSALVAAHLFRAAEELSQESQTFGELAKQTRRCLSPYYLVTLVLERGGPLAEATLKNAHVVRALALERESDQRFPSFPRVEQWALFRRVDPAQAGVLAEKLKTNHVARLKDELEYKFNPLNASAVLDLYWAQRMAGDEKKATEILDAARQAGVPLPARL